MKKLSVSTILVLLFSLAYSQSGVVIPLPDGPQLRWQNYEQTMFVCLDPCTWQGREYDNHSFPLSGINPVALNTDQWCETAISWGAKLILFVAKHTGGFCWWQTNTTSYGIKDTPWRNGKGDVLKDLSESCKKYGLGLGIYVYPGDDTWGAGIGSGGVTSDPSRQEAYNKVFREQMTEVLSKYGPVEEVWFDGSCKIEIGDILEKYASDAVILQGPKATIRWVGNESGYAPFSNWYTLKQDDMATGIATALQSDPFGDVYAPVEVDVPLLKNGGHKWFWAPGTDSLILTTDQLMDIYYKSVGRGAVLLLNSTPDTSGLIPETHVAAYKAFGKEIQRRFGSPLKSTTGKGNIIDMDFPEAEMVNHVILQEDIAMGQRVLAFEIAGQEIGGEWQNLYDGTSVGHRKICMFEPGVFKKLRVNFTNTKAEPQISGFSAYYVSDVKIEKENRKDRSKFYDLINRSQGSEYGETPFQVVASWECDREWKKVAIELTKQITAIGQYELAFITNGGAPEFNGWEMELYGSRLANHVKYMGGNNFRITRSQQTLDEFPAIFHVLMRNIGGSLSGEIAIRMITY